MAGAARVHERMDHEHLQALPKGLGSTGGQGQPLRLEPSRLVREQRIPGVLPERGQLGPRLQTTSGQSEPPRSLEGGAGVGREQARERLLRRGVLPGGGPRRARRPLRRHHCRHQCAGELRQARHVARFQGALGRLPGVGGGGGGLRTLGGSQEKGPQRRPAVFVKGLPRRIRQGQRSEMLDRPGPEGQQILLGKPRERSQTGRERVELDVGDGVHIPSRLHLATLALHRPAERLCAVAQRLDLRPVALLDRPPDRGGQRRELGRLLLGTPKLLARELLGQQRPAAPQIHVAVHGVHVPAVDQPGHQLERVDPRGRLGRHDAESLLPARRALPRPRVSPVEPGCPAAAISSTVPSSRRSRASAVISLGSNQRLRSLDTDRPPSRG